MNIIRDLRIYLNRKRQIPHAPRQWIVSQEDIPGCSKDELRLIQAGIARNAHEAHKILCGRSAAEVIANIPTPKINRLKRLERLVQRWQNARGIRIGYKPGLRVPIRVSFRLDD